jgi:hypothetical protein
MATDNTRPADVLQLARCRLRNLCCRAALDEDCPDDGTRHHRGLRAGVPSGTVVMLDHLELLVAGAGSP